MALLIFRIPFAVSKADKLILRMKRKKNSMKSKIKIVCFDLDNTICATPSSKNYEESVPYRPVINKINRFTNIREFC